MKQYFVYKGSIAMLDEPYSLSSAPAVPTVPVVADDV